MIKFHFKNYKKFIFVALILGSLFFVSVFFYNTKERTLAQEEFVWDCGNEIPSGEATDEALDMINKILTNADSLLSAAGQEIAAVNDIYELPLPDECQASNCQTGCTSYTYSCNPHPCDPANPLGPVCWDTCRTCTISPCTGNACPPDLVAEATIKAGQIAMLSGQITVNAVNIQGQRLRREGILEKLEEARRELEVCATPAAGYTAEEQVQLWEWLYSCQEAKFLKILKEDQEDCYRTNFFCCRPVQR